MTPQHLRPRDAARRFGVSKSTLSRWVKDGLVGRTTVGRCVWLNSSDLVDLIARNEQPRTAVPIPQRRADTAAAHAFFASARRS